MTAVTMPILSRGLKNSREEIKQMKVEDTITVTVNDRDSDFAGEMLYLIENNDLSFNDVIDILNTIAEIRDSETERVMANGHIIQVTCGNERIDEI